SKSKVTYVVLNSSPKKETSMTKKKQTAISGIYKENWYCNSMLSANKNWNTSANSGTGTFNRSTLKRRNCGESQQDSNVPSKRILRSTHVTECQVLQNNCERNTSASLLGIPSKSNKKLSAIKTSNVNIKDKATLKHDVQSRMCKSNRHCNLYDSNGINRKQNTKFQQENLLAYETNLSQRKSLKPKSRKNINQSNATNIPSSIVESNWERNYTTSIQTRRKGNCETIKSVTTEESNKFHLQIKGKERKDLDHAAETQCSTYKQYRTNGNLKQDEEINILYKSVFERRYTEFKDNGRKEIDANIKLERNTYKMSVENKVNTTETLRGKINFMQSERLRIECTLCNVQINSLFDFQQHVTDIHLQCKRKSLGRKTKFPVVIVNLNEQINADDRGSQFIFECCCCSRIFDRAIDFEEHINNMHRTSDVKRKCKSKRTAKSSELYATTFKDEQVVDETCALNEHYVFDISTNVDGISNQIITKENLEIIENVRRLNIDEKYGNGISRIAITSKSELTNIPSYTEINERFKAYQRHKRYSFSCDVCFKRYKRKHMFLSHMSKHVRGEQRKTQESDNPITLDNDPALNSNVKTCQGYIDSFEEDDDTSNPTVNLNELNQNTLISKMIDKNKEVSNSIENANMEYVTKEDSTSNKIDNYSYLLRINLTQKTEEGTKRQKSIKFDINVAKKYKTSSSNEQQNIENEIENKRPPKSSFTRNGSFAMTDTKKMDKKKKDESGVKKRQCNVCDKKFSSLTILKEHMFILHDSLLEDPELSNLPTMPRFNDNRKIQNLSTQDTYTLEEKRDLSHETRTRKKMLGNGDEHGKVTVYQTFNTDKKNRKWRCNACKENFALLRNYLRHKYYCHNDESVVHICDNCNKILTSVAMRRMLDKTQYELSFGESRPTYMQNMQIQFSHGIYVDKTRGNTFH
ncbi:unnamed protein product, partial [Heterotrigona itama]